MTIGVIQPDEVQELHESTGNIALIDVREADEFAEVSSPWAKNFPLSQLQVDSVLQKLGLSRATSQTPLYFICRSGARSRRAAEMFYDSGYKNVYNVDGGMLRWIELDLPTRGED